MENNIGKLYVVGTPIGNLDDFSERGRRTLSEVDFIAAEDTRVTGKLLARFGIKKNLVSYYEHNLRERGEKIIGRIMKGETCAVVTDAGMPCISDPGEDLVRLCAERGIEVNVVPSPTAAVSALAISGLPASRFSFEGFLSVTKAQRNSHLDEIKDLRRTLIFYEAPHKLRNTLRDLLEKLGDRRIALCRELTKIHEEVLRGKISDMIAYYDNAEHSPRGEYVLVIEGKTEDGAQNERAGLEDAVNAALELIAGGMKTSEACRKAASKTKFSKPEIYAAVMNAGKEKQ